MHQKAIRNISNHSRPRLNSSGSEFPTPFFLLWTMYKHLPHHCDSPVAHISDSNSHHGCCKALSNSVAGGPLWANRSGRPTATGGPLSLNCCGRPSIEGGPLRVDQFERPSVEGGPLRAALCLPAAHFRGSSFISAIIRNRYRDGNTGVICYAIIQNLEQG